jgi:hypothetical protein
VEGWVKDTDPNWPVSGGANNAVTNITNTTAKAHDGTHALAVSIISNGTPIFVTVPFCQGSQVNLAGYKMSAWLYLTTGGANDLTTEAIYVQFATWSQMSGNQTGPVKTLDRSLLNTWFKVETTFSSSDPADHVSIRFGPDSFSGTMYIDTVEITSP